MREYFRLLWWALTAQIIIVADPVAQTKSLHDTAQPIIRKV
jgi:hypothetical protein